MITIESAATPADGAASAASSRIRRVSILSLAAGALGLVLASAAPAAMTGTGDVHNYTYNGSRDRNYTVYVPQSYDGSQPVPMIFALHGCAMNHTDARNLWNFDLIADQHNVIVVFPFVTSFTEMRNENCWGYWLSNHIREGGGGEVDDLHGIAKAVEAQYQIDPSRRYITGLSSGGGMTVAAAIAYNEYWAAAAPVAGLAYGDWASSVTADLFQSLATHNTAIANELDDPRPIPMLVIQSSNDTVVMPTAMELIRDSHLSAFGADLGADGSESCTTDGIACTLTTYNDSDGNPLVKTLLYSGVDAKSASYGKGHYWSGGDEAQDKWSKSTGPKATEAIWDFFSQVTLDGYLPPAQCEGDNTAPAAPTGLAALNVGDKYAALTLNPNGESDLKGYKIYQQDGTSLTGSPVANPQIALSGLSAETSYQVYATALDLCGNESAPSASVGFTTTALEYVAPSVSATATAHYNAGRVNAGGYVALGQKYGYVNAFPLWQLQDGSWTDVNPNGGDAGTGGGTGGGDVTPGAWTTRPSQSGMEVHLYTPTTTTANGKRALMIALHGCAQSNEVVRDNWSWDDEADEYGMVIAAPAAPNGGVIAGCWDYYDSNHSRANPSRHDDNLIDLAQALLADASLNIDPAQVYISGLSSGGGQTFVMGCLAPDIFAGIGINAGPAVGTSSGQIGSVAVSATQARNTCMNFANSGGNAGDFATQLTSVVHGKSDHTVAQGYADVAADAMAMIYGASKDSGSNSIATGGAEQTWSDADGKRVQKIMVTGLGHAWPAGSDSSGGGYTDHATVDYPAVVTKFFFDNNRRVIVPEEDVVPPAVPTALAVTGSSASSVTLAWNAVGDGDLAHYTLYVDGQSYATTTATTLTVTGLQAATSYSFTVTASDTSGNESSASAAVQGSTQAGGGDTTAPAVPTALLVTATGETTLSLDWADNVESDLAGYKVYLNGNPVADVSVSAHTFTGLAAGTGYALSVRAYDQAGNLSDAAAINASTDQPQPQHSCTQTTSSNYAHVQAGRAQVCSLWYACAVGSGTNLGLNNTFASNTLKQTAPGYYEVGSCQ